MKSFADTTRQIQTQLAQRREETEAREIAAEEAERLAGEVDAYKDELEKLERRHVALARFGKQRITHPVELNVAGIGQVVFEPLRSAATGAELAERLAPRIESCKAEIGRRESEIQELLK